jgi:hypothetical protein
MRFKINYFFGWVTSGVCAALAFLVVEKAFLRILRDAGVKTAVLTKEDVDEVHGRIIMVSGERKAKCLDRCGTMFWGGNFVWN